jgi:hypothetical protein
VAIIPCRALNRPGVRSAHMATITKKTKVVAAPAVYNSSRWRGQSSFKSRDRERSARIRPPV